MQHTSGQRGRIKRGGSMQRNGPSNGKCKRKTITSHTFIRVEGSTITHHLEYFLHYNTMELQKPAEMSIIIKTLPSYAWYASHNVGWWLEERRWLGKVFWGLHISEFWGTSLSSGLTSATDSSSSTSPSDCCGLPGSICMYMQGLLYTWSACENNLGLIGKQR